MSASVRVGLADDARGACFLFPLRYVHAAVWSWGQVGALGHGDGQDQCQPTKVEALVAGQRVVAVWHCHWAGDSHSLAITAGGSVWSWGFGEDGHAQSQLLPKKVEALAGCANGAVWIGQSTGFDPSHRKI